MPLAHLPGHRISFATALLSFIGSYTLFYINASGSTFDLAACLWWLLGWGFFMPFVQKVYLKRKIGLNLIHWYHNNEL